MQSKILKVGITGGIGAGKSLISSLFAILGVPIYDSDNRAKWLMNHDQQLIGLIKRQFGPSVYKKDGQLDRVEMAKKVFTDSKRLSVLNGLVHPALEKDFISWTEMQEGSRYIMKEAALLVETGSYKKLDFLIVVSAPVPTRIARVMKRDRHRSKSDIEKIILKQINDNERNELADIIILNDETRLLLPQVLKAHDFFVNYNNG